ncbi:hypothetical protein [Clostridium lundense]|uniref:hypothetical protein n=1 Tax=Clostridium lundense TaxID=319475 RepID=UPI000481073B|nr:hypothetical protein [Clostridium lundense]
MNEHKEIKTSLEIALLFIIITSIFSLPSKLSTLILNNVGFKNGINIFIRHNILWIIVVSITIILLKTYIKESNKTGYLNLLENKNVSLTTGILVALQGLINLSNLLPAYIMSIQSSLQLPNSFQSNIKLMREKIIIIDVISIAMILCQIFFGVYLAKYHKRK